MQTERAFLLNTLSRPIWPARASSPSRATAIWLVLALVALVISVFRVRSFPADDAALFEYVGRAIVHGQRLYADIWDNKLPSIYLVNATWQLLFGSNYLLHTVAEVAVNAISVVLFAAILKLSGVRYWSACTCVLAWTLSIATILDADEYYALAFIMLAYWLSVSRRSAVVAGIALGIAMTFWIPSLLLLFPLWTDERFRRSRRSLVSAFAVTVAAYGIAMVIAFGPNTVAELVRSWFSYLTYHRGTEQPLLSRIYTGLLTSGAGIVLAAFAMVVRRPVDRNERFALQWCGVTLLGAIAPLKFYPHYFVPTFPPLIFAIGVFGFQWRVVRPRLILVALAAFFAAKSLAYKMKVSPGVRAQESAFAVGQRIKDAFGSGTVLSTPDYAPEIYLASDAMLTDRFALAGPANVGFMQTRLNGKRREPLVIVEISRNHVIGDVDKRFVQVCTKEPAGFWTVYVRSNVVPQFSCR